MFCSVLLFCGALLVSIQFKAASGRVFASPSLGTVFVDAPDKAPLLWEREHLRGRILLLFDRYPHFNGYAFYQNRKPPLTRHNFVEYAVFQNMVRMIFYIVPDSEWPRMLEQQELKIIRSTVGPLPGVYLPNLNGTPVIATSFKALPRLPEQPLVYINETLFNGAETRTILQEKGISSDCVIVFRGDRR